MSRASKRLKSESFSFRGEAVLALAVFLTAGAVSPLPAEDKRHKYGIRLTEEQRAPLDILDAGTFEHNFEGIQVRAIAENATLYGKIPATYRIFINSDNPWVWGGWEENNSDSALLRVLRKHRGPIPISDELLTYLIANIKGHSTKSDEGNRAIVSLRAIDIILNRDPSRIPNLREHLIVRLADLISGPRPNQEKMGISIPDERGLAIRMAEKYGLHSPAITESVREATKNPITIYHSKDNFRFRTAQEREKYLDEAIEEHIRYAREHNEKVVKPALLYLAKHGSLQDMQAFRDVIDLESWQERDVPEGRKPYMGDFVTSLFAAIQLKALGNQCGQKCVAAQVLDSAERGIDPWERSPLYRTLQTQLKQLRSQLK